MCRLKRNGARVQLRELQVRMFHPSKGEIRCLAQFGSPGLSLLIGIIAPLHVVSCIVLFGFPNFGRGKLPTLIKKSLDRLQRGCY
jgi:hypothetical protein